MKDNAFTTSLKHVALIMDGNGRWAKSRNLPRTRGHKRGLDVAKTIVKAARESGIEAVSLYVFSTENWKRAEEEVDFLMSLIATHLRKEFTFYKENGIRVLHSGDIEGLPQEIRKEIVAVMRETADFKDMTVNLAVNYGGRNEIMRAANRILSESLSSSSARSPLKNEAEFTSYLDCPSLPEIDLVIRTGGEKRLSNFMLYESSYAELIFTPTLWPDYTPEEFFENIREYNTRQRRFGNDE